MVNLKQSNLGNWHKMAKQIGAVDQMNGHDLVLEQLEGLTNQQSAESIAKHFSEISNEYLPLNIQNIPAYLPAEKPPR